MACKDEHGMTIKQRLAELKEKREKATQGEWHEFAMYGDSGDWAQLKLPHHPLMAEMLKASDCFFIVDWVNAFPDILTYIEELERKVAAGEALAEAVESMIEADREHGFAPQNMQVKMLAAYKEATKDV